MQNKLNSYIKQKKSLRQGGVTFVTSAVTNMDISIVFIEMFVVFFFTTTTT